MSCEVVLRGFRYGDCWQRHTRWCSLVRFGKEVCDHSIAVVSGGFPRRIQFLSINILFARLVLWLVRNHPAQVQLFRWFCCSILVNALASLCSILVSCRMNMGIGWAGASRLAWNGILQLRFVFSLPFNSLHPSFFPSLSSHGGLVHCICLDCSWSSPTV
mgnify:CR=1 FL=1